MPWPLPFSMHAEQVGSICIGLAFEYSSMFGPGVSVDQEDPGSLVESALLVEHAKKLLADEPFVSICAGMGGWQFVGIWRMQAVLSTKIPGQLKHANNCLLTNHLYPLFQAWAASVSLVDLGLTVRDARRIEHTNCFC